MVLKIMRVFLRIIYCSDLQLSLNEKEDSSGAFSRLSDEVAARGIENRRAAVYRRQGSIYPGAPAYPGIKIRKRCSKEHSCS